VEEDTLGGRRPRQRPPSENDTRQVMAEQSWHGAPPIAAFAPNIPQGQYANFIQVASTQWEFVFDFAVIESAIPFGQGLSPGYEQVPASLRPIARIFVSPQNLKGLWAVLGEAIRKYEAAWHLELPDMRDSRSEEPEATEPPSSEQ